MTETRAETLLRALAGEEVTIDFEPTCDFEEILLCLINGEEWQGTPNTRLEELLVQLQGGGGGGVEETLLWTNPNPTANIDNSTTIPEVNKTVFESYDALKFVILDSTSASINEAKEMYLKRTNIKSYGGLLMGAYLYSREFIISASGIKFYSAYVGGRATPDNSKSIPYQIYGVNF